MHLKLFIPGPTEVREDVLKMLSKPVIGHRSKDMSDLYERIHNNLQKFFNTNYEVEVFTTSGTGLMEGSIRNVVQSKILNLINGSFSDRWYKIALANGKDAKAFEYEWGKAVKPGDVENLLEKEKFEAVALTHNETSTGVRSPFDEISKIAHDHDALLIVDAVSSLAGDLIDVNKADVIFAPTQKSFALPPGLAIAFISPAAMEKAKTVKDRGYFFDFIAMHDYYVEKKQIPATPAVSLFYALDYQLEKMLKEGMEQRYNRHKEMARMVQDWAKKNFDLFAEPGYESVTVTTVKNTKNINVENLRKELRARGMEISNGYGKLKEKTFRIAHMGDLTPAEIKELLDTMDEILNR
ncbi:MAG: pyridoxal-phosphate-dependent aminotransferase family protein [Thermoplasmata archaeon]|nr:alanine--glyoxylate aminotransferase family protein [Thermoplasmata archaeon]